MPGFYHFLPGATKADIPTSGKLSLDVLARHGLDDVLADCLVVPDQCVVWHGVGPTGESGALLYPRPKTGTDPKQWHYVADIQTWLPVADGSQRWIGWQTDSPPGPEDLERRFVHHAYSLKDSLDRDWLVPMVRSPDPQRGSLPVDYTFNGTGELVRRTKPEHQRLWDLTGEIVDSYIKGEGEKRDELWQVKAAIEILSCNYRLGTGELQALYECGCGLLDTQRVGLILLMACDWELVGEYESKKNEDLSEADSLNALSGAEGSDPATLQHAGS